MSTPDRRAMLDRPHPVLSIRGQCRLLGLTRSGGAHVGDARASCRRSAMSTAFCGQPHVIFKAPECELA